MGLTLGVTQMVKTARIVVNKPIGGQQNIEIETSEKLLVRAEISKSYGRKEEVEKS